MYDMNGEPFLSPSQLLSFPPIDLFINFCFLSSLLSFLVHLSLSPSSPILFPCPQFHFTSPVYLPVSSSILHDCPHFSPFRVCLCSSFPPHRLFLSLLSSFPFIFSSCGSCFFTKFSLHSSNLCFTSIYSISSNPVLEI